MTTTRQGGRTGDARVELVRVLAEAVRSRHVRTYLARRMNAERGEDAGERSDVLVRDVCACEDILVSSLSTSLARGNRTGRTQPLCLPPPIPIVPLQIIVHALGADDVLKVAGLRAVQAKGDQAFCVGRPALGGGGASDVVVEQEMKQAVRQAKEGRTSFCGRRIGQLVPKRGREGIPDSRARTSPKPQHPHRSRASCATPPARMNENKAQQAR